MTDCKHDRIQTWRIEDGTPAGLWSCVDCAVKFVPMSELEREKATPEAPQPAKRVQLTDDDIDVLWAKQQTKPFKTHAEDRMAFARAVIAAYERKNGITGETK